ncbi:MAG TPA: NAD(P)H-hydrate dehydratase [Melioribacteraceae bacterium]|nr:NAD(P)H-hydrate dehydratase [Melioribacteraceae bacterium]
MIPLFDKRLIRAADNFAVNQLSIPGIILMENAALNCYYTIIKEHPINYGIIGLVCGKGNNGGDGFAIARHFVNNGYVVKVIIIPPEKEIIGDALINYTIINQISKTNENLKIKFYKEIKNIKYLNECDIIIDAILGTGFSDELKRPLSDIVNSLNQIKSYKVSIDVPTGLDLDKGYGTPIFKADLTITLGDYKTGLFYGKGAINCGKIVKENIGLYNSYFDSLSTETYLVEPKDGLKYLPERKFDANKYSSGKVLVIGSSKKYPGAGILCANSSLISGSGATSIAIPSNILGLVFPKLLEATIKTYNNDDYFNEIALLELSNDIEKADVIALGCGLDRNEETIQACGLLLKKYYHKTIIIDADAIFCLVKYGLDNLNLENCVFTPHLGEFSLLTNVNASELQKNLLYFGSEFTKRTKSFLVLKGAPTVVFLPNGKVFINSSGNNGMAKFGMGDVLTGVISSFIAQSNNIENSILSAVYLHSLSADLLAEEKTEYGFTAKEVAENLPKSIKFLRGMV